MSARISLMLRVGVLSGSMNRHPGRRRLRQVDGKRVTRGSGISENSERTVGHSENGRADCAYRKYRTE
jgi:hypothetical protein